MIVCYLLTFLLAFITEYKIMVKILEGAGRTPKDTGSMDDLPVLFMSLVFGVASVVGTYYLSTYISYGAALGTVLTVPAVVVVMLVLKHGIACIRWLIRAGTSRF
ncbi:MAG: hypothetical protein K2W82_16870 [Candidatus Obscuribacterales bacterium]|nr:hypothetical protein [Candidatus Obscuribacterales bacterium]